MTEMVLPQEAMLIKSAGCTVFLNCHRLRHLWPHYSGLAIKNQLFHSSGNYEACLSVLYTLGTQLYHPLQITSSTQRGSPWFSLSACRSGGFVLHSAADLYPSPYTPKPTENVTIPEDFYSSILVCKWLQRFKSFGKD